MTTAAERIPWWKAEPGRFARDTEEITSQFPELAYLPTDQGSWLGRLPMWPFQRPEPPGLATLLGGRGLLLRLDYVPAYPIVSPYLFPEEPEPEIIEWTQTRWHVLGNGALCQFQTQADWNPASSVTDLLRRAAGWRIEYALMKAGARTDMTIAGIARDNALDELITQTARAISQPEDAS